MRNLLHAACVASLALSWGGGTAARADSEAGRAHPVAIGKLGVGLPGVPGFAAEVFLAERWTVQGEGGSGPLGPYAAASLRWRPCWGCAHGAGFALGLGPELDVLFDSDDGRTGYIAALLVEPAYVQRLGERFGLALGLKFALGYEWDYRNGERVAAELANTFGIFAGVIY